MAVRRQINRYRTAPNGYDYDEVLKKGKAFYRTSEEFEMSPYKGNDGKILWTAEHTTLPTFKPAEGTRRYKFNRDRKKWEEVNL